MFAGKHGFITPRDLFKWAERGAIGYEQLAQNGYLMLGERLRTAEDRAVVQRVLEKQMKVQVGLCCTAAALLGCKHLLLSAIMVRMHVANFDSRVVCWLVLHQQACLHMNMHVPVTGALPSADLCLLTSPSIGCRMLRSC